jgi:hypothetical protein
MSVTITRNPGQGNALFYSSGSISFSSLRSNFKETGSGSISASELRRNTNTSAANPIVPDATHNEQISTGSNLKISQFRNSVKRYLATQSGTDDNSSYSGEPGFRLGLYDPNGRGLDFAGGGVNGRDGQGGNSTGNHIKNVQKIVRINGTCGSVQVGVPAAQLAPRLTVNNFRIEVYGSILGYGGLGSTSEGADGQDGGIALNLGSIGSNNRVFVGSSARIYGGGGGGEHGRKGANGSNGTCFNYFYYDRGSGCEWCGSCNGGDDRIGGCNGVRGCACFIWCRRTQLANARCRGRNQSGKAGGTGGNGGVGGNGRGYNNQSGSIGGSSGANGQSGNCNGFDGTISRPGDGQRGGNGGNGGDWGQNGGETSASGRAGSGGKAIAATGTQPAVSGTRNSSTIRGSIY